ncbi:MAG: FtsW/RodA/SpoVE family cell cycle protein [Phycisphaerales bacterium]|nr:FtsW/RodA/SpoVE family cell cycle protein [Phycisphaerales bacterium]
MSDAEHHSSRWWLVLVWLLPMLAMIGTAWWAPLWLEPRVLKVSLEPGQTAALGREALQAPQADSEHVLLRRNTDGGWSLSNIAAYKQVLWRSARGGDVQPIRDWLLRKGATFAVGDYTFRVLEAAKGRIRLQEGKRHWEYDGFRAHLDGQPLPECYPGWRSRWSKFLAALGLRDLVRRPLRLGGGVYCADRLGLTEVPVDTVVIAPVGVDFMLRPGEAGRPDGSMVTVAVDTPEAESLWRRSVPLAVGDDLTIGRTQYRVLRITPDLELAVVARAQRWPAAVVPRLLTPPVEVHWRPVAWLWPPGVDTWIWPLSLAIPLLALGLLWPRQIGGGEGMRDPRELRDPRDPLARWRLGGALALAGACLGFYLSRLTVPILWPYLLAWPALLLWLITVRSPWSIRLLVVLTLLLGVGWVTLLQLGAGAEESGWTRFGGGGAALAGTFGWLMWAGRHIWRRWRPDQRFDVRLLARWGLLLLSGVALISLAWQAGFGDEDGWNGFQPFEFAKLTLVLVTAHVLMASTEKWRIHTLFWWVFSLGSVVLLLAASGFALVFLHDFSPLMLLSLWVLALVWAYLRVISRPLWRWGGQVVLLIVVGALAVGVIWLRQSPESFPVTLQATRIRAWAMPEQYPHSAYQLRRALEAIRAGGWTGSIWRDPVNSQAMKVPLVENDFTPTFFLNRYGGLAALGLMVMQMALILLLGLIAERALWSAWHGVQSSIIPGGFAYFVLYGGAALLGAHFLVSWGTNLGFLPVMGQPMSLLSSAGSHLVLFVLPIVALAVAVEEGN